MGCRSCSIHGWAIEVFWSEGRLIIALWRRNIYAAASGVPYDLLRGQPECPPSEVFCLNLSPLRLDETQDPVNLRTQRIPPTTLSLEAEANLEVRAVATTWYEMPSSTGLAVLKLIKEECSRVLKIRGSSRQESWTAPKALLSKSSLLLLLLLLGTRPIGTHFNGEDQESAFPCISTREQDHEAMPFKEGLSTLLCAFYDLQEMGKVNKLYKADLQLSLRSFPICVVEDKIKNLVGENSVYKLVSSFLNLPIIDYYGYNCKDLMFFSGIPSVGEISKVLLKKTLRGTFDREFSKRFPGIAFFRFHYEVYIFTTENEKVIFDDKALYKLLGELCMLGKIVSIGPGDEPLPSSSNKLLFVDSDSKVEKQKERGWKAGLRSAKERLNGWHRSQRLRIDEEGACDVKKERDRTGIACLASSGSSLARTAGTEEKDRARSRVQRCVAKTHQRKVLSGTVTERRGAMLDPAKSNIKGLRRGQTKQLTQKEVAFDDIGHLCSELLLLQSFCSRILMKLRGNWHDYGALRPNFHLPNLSPSNSNPIIGKWKTTESINMTIPAMALGYIIWLGKQLRCGETLPNLKVQRIKLLFSSSNTADGFLGDYRLTKALSNSSVILPSGLWGVYSTHPHCSSKCATPYEDLLPFCPLSVHAVLKAEEERCSSRSFPVHSLYISDTEGRTRWEGSYPSLYPADHSAGILHSRLRLTAARGCSCRYVSLSGSLAPPVIFFYDMLLSSPYSICHLVISASLRVRKKKGRTSFSDPAIAL
ncbi:hypothetical protein ZIOFF_074341 (mitochondrion) [Zingiber officinale]|uniref:Uncharacterized protein n=1 Tax=Zingiber officinale TaxID=94328 RepID=A0A8J5ENL7_ZINOF|nr:hypothetical protein ZIOFF_074341 [Zingiber officinale]